MSGRIGTLRRARRVCHALLGLAAAGLLLLSMPAAGADRVRHAGPLNVVVIMTDDQTVESLRVMTNVNRMLVGLGTTFVNSFVSYPLCCPSRGTFLTGQYSHNNGVVGNNYINGLSRLDQTNTLAVWLKAAGYTTVMVGKYLNGYGMRSRATVPPGWSQWYGAVRLGYFNHTMSRNGKLTKYGNAPADYQSDVYTRTAVDFIRKHGRSTKPFFLWLSYWAPHSGSPREVGDPADIGTPAAAPRYRGRFASEPLPMPPSFDELDVSDKPTEIRNKPRFTPEKVAGIRTDYRQRLESLLAVDDGVKRVIDALKARGQLKRTLIVFTSDNGYLLGEHRVATGKELPYEPSIRVPLIIRGPGVPVGRKLDQPVANTDLAPTIVGAAKARPRRVLDGRSLFPLFTDPALEWGRDLLLERGPGQGYLGARQYTGIHTPRYVYIEYRTGERELYDLANDPDQLRSRHDDPAYASVQSELARRLAALRDCAGSSCRQAPALELALGSSGGCVRSVRLAGLDERLVAYVDFIVNGRGAGRDEAAPFELSVAPPIAGGPTTLRILAVLHDGRRLTLDRNADVCR